MVDVTQTQFDPHVVERCTSGAGVLPFARRPDGALVVLLARERYFPAWRGSCRWSAFEGTRLPGETVAENAAREFDEESLGVLRAVLPEGMHALLEKRTYAFRIVLRILSDNPVQRYHCTYAVEVPWCPEFPQDFSATRTRLELIERLAQEWEHARSLADPTTALECSHIKARLDRAMTNHPCIRKTFAPDGTFEHVELATEHMEKDQMRWWRHDELETVMKNHGRIGMDRFRPYFIPVLQTFLQQYATT